MRMHSDKPCYNFAGISVVLKIVMILVLLLAFISECEKNMERNPRATVKKLNSPVLAQRLTANLQVGPEAQKFGRGFNCSRGLLSKVSEPKFCQGFCGGRSSKKSESNEAVCWNFISDTGHTISKSAKQKAKQLQLINAMQFCDDRLGYKYDRKLRQWRAKHNITATSRISDGVVTFNKNFGRATGASPSFELQRAEAQKFGRNAGEGITKNKSKRIVPGHQQLKYKAEVRDHQKKAMQTDNPCSEQDQVEGDSPTMLTNSALMSISTDSDDYTTDSDDDDYVDGGPPPTSK